jgi:RNA polymerase sigma-70 factor (ECF subfamily)
MEVSSRDGRFSTTRWSVVLAAGGAGDRTGALKALCETYWRPVYAFIRRSGHSADEASDLTQAFFLRVLEQEFFSFARRDRGRFRSFLLASVRHFVANVHEQQRASKRGGGVPHLSLMFVVGEREYSLEPVERLTPERLYERQWGLTILSEALDRVAREYSESGRGALFTALRPFITGDQDVAYATLASDLGMSPGAVRVAVHRLRQQCGRSLRTLIADTVSDVDDVDRELEYLLRVLSEPH